MNGIQRSLSGSVNRNFGGSFNLGLGRCVFGIVTVVLPIRGFGSMRNVQNAFDQNDDWPNVFGTLTETWYCPDFSGSRTSSWPFYMDVGMVQTSSGSPWENPITGNPATAPVPLNCNNFYNITGSEISSGGKTLTIRWAYNPYSAPSTVSNGVYTAQLLGENSWGTWEDLTTLAVGILDAVPDPALSASPIYLAGLPGTVPSPPYHWQVIYAPVSPGWTPVAPTQGPFNLGPVCGIISWDGYSDYNHLAQGFIGAAACGLGVRGSGSTGIYSFDHIVGPALALNDHESGFSNLQNTSGILPNVGGLICSKSRWALLGQPPVVAVADDNQNDHFRIWAQQMTVGGTPLVAALQSGIATPFKTYGRGVYSFGPNDVLSALGAGTYGLLGFVQP